MTPSTGAPGPDDATDDAEPVELSFDRLERKPAYFTVADTIRRRIVSGELHQESYLPAEHDFADQLGVTRQTLREAVRLLETSGLVTRGKRRRLMVARPSTSAVGGSFREAMILYQVTYGELHDLHLALEPGMAAVAAKNITEPEKDALKANIARMAEAVAADQDTLDLDIEFHTLVMNATNNRPLQLAFDANMDALYTAFARVLPAIDNWQAKRVLEAHQHIANAVIGGDAEVARLWMTRHLEDVRHGCDRAGLDMDQPFTPGWQAPAPMGAQPAR